MPQAHTARSARDERDQWRELPDERDQRGTSETSVERDQWRELPDERDQRETSGNQPAKRDQWRELPDEPEASGSGRLCGQKRISHLGRRPRDECARREPSFG